MEKMLFPIGPGIPGISPVADLRGEASRALVVLCHGLSASKESMIPEMEKLHQNGVLPVAIDAPHHGERCSGWLETMERSGVADRHHLFLDAVAEAGRELNSLIAHLREGWNGTIGVIGVSMGGFMAYASLLGNPQPDICIPILASPRFYSYNPMIGENELEKRLPSPDNFPELFSRVSLFSVSAGLDEKVLPEGTISFFRSLKQRFPDSGERLKLVQYPESGHFMRPEDWEDAWQKIISWLNRRTS